MAILSLARDFPEVKQSHNFLAPDSVLKLLTITDKKSTSIDILIIILTHLESFLGNTEITEKLQSGTSLEIIIDSLQPEQTKLMNSNLLRYCASIGDKNIFI